MARELAIAYVNIVAAANSIAPTVRKELAKVEDDGAATSARVGSSFTGALKTATNAGATLLTTLTTGLLALAGKGGFTRALNIDTAEAKMTALGYTQQAVVDVMQTALASVKGTAFGLGDAATLATQLLASGIKPGADLARALGNTADLAAVAGVNLGDLQSVMGQLVGKGRLYTEDLMQLGERGLPVFAWLADSMGVTQEKIRDMVSEGKLDFADFQRAVEEHIGGAAKATDSYKSSWENIKAALSRGGAVVATPVLDQLKAIYDVAIPVVDKITESIKPLVDVVVARLTPAFDTFLNALSGTSSFGAVDGLLGLLNDLGVLISGLITGDGLAGIEGLLSGIGAVLGPIVGMIASVGGSSIAAMLGPLGVLIPQVTPLVGGLLGLLVSLLTQSEALRGAFGQVFDTLGRAINTLQPYLQPLVEAFGDLAQMLGATLSRVLMTVVVPTLSFLGEQVLPAILPVLTDIIDAFSSGLGPALGMLVPILQMIVQQAMPAFMGVLNTLLPIIDSVAKQALPALLPLLSTLASTFGGALAQALSAVLPALQSIVNAVLPALSDVLTTLGPIIAGVAYQLGDIFGQAISLLAPVIEQLTPILGELITMIGGILAEVLTEVSPLLSTLADFLMQLMPIVMQLVPPLLQIVEALLPLVGVVGDLITSLLPPLVDLIMAILPPLLEVITNIVDALVPALTWLAGVIRDYVVPYLQLVIDFWSKVITVVIDVVKVIVEKLLQALDWWQDRMVKLPGAIRDMVERGINLIKGMAEIWKQKIEEIIGDVLGIKAKIEGAFLGAGDWLIDTGKNIIKGLIEGLKSQFTKVKDTLSNLTDLIPTWKGPAEVDAKLLTGPGQKIIRSLVTGFQIEAPAAKAYLGDFTSQLAAVDPGFVSPAAQPLTRADLEAFAKEISERIAGLAAIITDQRLDTLTERVRDTRRQGGEVTV